MRLVQLLVLAFLCVQTLVSAERTPKIAIIGGGIAGTGSCYYAKQTFKNADVYLFESDDQLGGRIKSAQVDEHTFELGAHLIVEGCQYMRQLLQDLKLAHQPLPQEAENHLVDGSASIFQMGSDNGALFTLLWQYGFGLSDIVDYVKQLDSKFAAIYALQKQGYAFTDLTGLLTAVDSVRRGDSLLALMNVSIATVFRRKDFSQEFLTQVVQALEFRTYGQSVDHTNFFAGILPLSAAAGGEITALKDGTLKLVEQLASECKPQLVNSRVSKIEKKVTDGQVSYSLFSEDGQELLQADYVIVAAPQFQDQAIEYAHAQLELPFSTYYVSVVKGQLNRATFDFAEPATVQNVFSFKLGSSFFSIERLYDVNGKLPSNAAYFKVTSPQELTPQLLAKLFSKAELSLSHKWHAAPNYKESLKMFAHGKQDQRTRFQLDEHLYYVSPIELMRSTMEHSLIAAKNAVLLAFNDWNKVQKHSDHFEFANDEALIIELSNDAHARDEL